MNPFWLGVIACVAGGIEVIGRGREEEEEYYALGVAIIVLGPLGLASYL